MVRNVLIAATVCIALWLLALLALTIAGKRLAARQLAAAVPDLLALLKGLLGDPRIPRRSKRWVWIALIWVLSPIDLIPEFLPVIGPLDDIVVVLLVLRHLVKTAPEGVVTEHWRGDPQTLAVMMRMAGATAQP
jgi:uncharacterized membrane protein YkvA (DUF1232 family)